MALRFYINPNVYSTASNTAFLQPNNWDDYGYKTLFNLIVNDTKNGPINIGSVKIGYIGQDRGWTKDKIREEFEGFEWFEVLPSHFYSLGQDADYYQNIMEKLSPDTQTNLLSALGDVVYDEARLKVADKEGAFHTSLLRSLYRTTIDHQFKRILKGDAPLTKYNFSYEKEATDRYSGIKVEFEVNPDKKPSSNIHIIIGRNGIGKTTLLNNMVNALLPGRGSVEDTGYFRDKLDWGFQEKLADDYFAGVVSVSFSAFDPFKPPPDQPDVNGGMRYYYVGLKKKEVQNGHERWILKNKEDDLWDDFFKSLEKCFALSAKKERWITAIKRLESDTNFADMDLCKLPDIHERPAEYKRTFSDYAKSRFDRMSSGHAIVLLTITRLIETVEEKTLVLIDEPESHLHPPLLSSFTRALSELLLNRNGVAIVATHSPVVLQEVPKSCVSILRRTGLNLTVERPQIETFAENVGVLTREVFGLEVSKSGFHELLKSSVDKGGSYETIVEEYNYQLGFEGRALLRSMIATRDLNHRGL